MNPPDLNGKKVALAGFGAEGRSTAGFLAKAGARLEVFESKPEQDFSAEVVADLRARGVFFHFGFFGPFLGFDILFCSPGIRPDTSELARAAEKGTRITSATELFMDLCPCPVIGVTGTKGKGTTSSLIYQMFLAAGRDAYLCGNIGAPALDFLDKLNKDSVVVYEMSSFQLMGLHCSPSVAVVLMISTDHLDFHKDRAEYVSAKSNIVRFQRADDKAILNADNSDSSAMAFLTAAEVSWFSRQKEVARGAYVSQDGNIILTDGGGKRVIIRDNEVPLAGAHNLENVCAAITVASLLGVDDKSIVAAIKEFRSLPHRLELVHEARGIRYYDDSISTTPESAIAALRAFDASKVMILGGSSKGADWSELATELVRCVSLRAVVGIGKEWQNIKRAITEQAAVTGNNIDLIDGGNSMKAAVAAAAATAKAGDVIVLSPACASFDMFRDYKDRGEQFSAAAREV